MLRYRLLKKLINYSVRGLLFGCLAAALAVGSSVLYLRAIGEQLLSVQTKSMAPTFSAGDAVILGPLKGSRPRPGDIISYHDPRNPKMILTHRLIHVDSATGWLTTAGDALRTPDSPFAPHLVVGQVRAIAPGLGTVVDTFRRPAVLFAVVYLPALLLIVSETERLAGHYAPRRYQLFS